MGSGRRGTANNEEGAGGWLRADSAHFAAHRALGVNDTALITAPDSVLFIYEQGNCSLHQSTSRRQR